MKIDILFQLPMHRWQGRLADVLGAAGHEVRCIAGQGRKSLPFGVTPALALERRVFGPPSSLFDTIAVPASKASAPPDLVIALDGVVSDAGTVLEPLFDDRAGDAALLSMLASGGTPCVRVRRQDEDLVVAHLAVEDRDILSRALDQVLARVVTLVVQAARRIDQPGLPTTIESKAARPIVPLAFMARGFIRKLAGRLPRARLSPNHWRLAYRHVEGPDVAQTRVWPSRGFTVLKGGADRFHADPMPFEQDGRSFIFFEDYPYATEKGVIDVIEIAADGSASQPRTVLEQPCHLSYPLVLRHGGGVYMLPEMSAARRVQLFRADPFPDRWVPDRILLDGVVAGDATPVLHDGQWWLFATLSDDGGSSWDQLGLFHAPDLLGPWTPHADNPVLVDPGAARPAGPMWHEDGVLMRVAQDCRRGYGVGLAICRVDRLDRGGYAQTVVARLDPPAGFGADGVHTLVRAGALEVIDLRFARYPGTSSRTGT